MKAIWQNDDILSAIIEELQTIHHCHTIILYGSRARGDCKSSSDYDVAGIRSQGDKEWIARLDEKHQVFFDIFIYPEKELEQPNESHLQMVDGIILIEKDNFGKQLLESLKSIAGQALAISDEEIASRKIWYKKMLARAAVSDLEGRYRHIWSLFTLLEDYFSFKKLRYQGPKKGFQYLAKHDQEILNLFEKALANTNDIKLLKQLIEKISDGQAQQ